MNVVVNLGFALLVCGAFAVQTSAEPAPVEDRSTISPTAGSNADQSPTTYSGDLREPYNNQTNGRNSAQVNRPAASTATQDQPRNSLDNPRYPSQAIERPRVDNNTQPGRMAPPNNSSLTSRGASAGVAGANAPTSGSQLFYKVQILEQEVRDLRGLIEQQTHQLNRLAREQKDQYLDIDRRLSQQVKANGPNSNGGSRAGPASVAGPSATQEQSDDPETQAYNAAFALTRDKKYQQAIDGFNALVMDYPNGQLTGNAFYWLGELYLTLPEPELEKSRQSFVQVINLYPDHSKIPDSLYKLGVVYHRLGDLVRARQYLNQVSSQYPASASARLAQSYLVDLP